MYNCWSPTAVKPGTGSILGGWGMGWGGAVGLNISVVHCFTRKFYQFTVIWKEEKVVAWIVPGAGFIREPLVKWVPSQLQWLYDRLE